MVTHFIKNRFFMACFLCLSTAGCGPSTAGQATLSPNKRWFVDVQGSIGTTKACTFIRVYDTTVYPELKNVNATPRGTPTASYTVPIPFPAYEGDLKWNAAGTVLQMREDGTNKSALDYNLDLTTFSFSKVGTN